MPGYGKKERDRKALLRMLSLPLAELIPVLIIIVISLTVHEFAHSLMAIRLGDITPRQDGRMTLNPLAHIDLIGFVMLVVAGFGWAKPVRINTGNLKKPRRDEILISIAGPLANLLLALFAALVLKIVIISQVPASQSTLTSIARVITQVAAMNVALAIFNMLPIPPLDGSHLVTPFLSRANMNLAVTYFRYGAWALLALIVFERITNIEILPISRLTGAIVFGIYRLLGIF